MRLSIIAASFPATLLAIACDGHIIETATPVDGTQPTLVVQDGKQPIATLAGAGSWKLPGTDVRWTHLPAPKRPLPPTAPEDPTPEPVDPMAECAAIDQRAFGAVEQARTASAGCASDNDCTLSFADTSCGGMSIFAVSFIGLSPFEAAVAGIDGDICAERGADCPIIVADLFGQPRSMCIEGTCQLEVQGPDEMQAACDAAPRRDTIEGCLDCGTAMMKASTAVHAIAAELAACEVDADCVQVSDDTGCSSTCGVAINANALPAWDEARANVAADYCGASDCPIAMAGCLPQAAVCDAGQCKLVGTW